MRFFLLIPTLLGCLNTRITEDDFLVSYPQEMCANIFSCVAEEDQATLEEFYGSQEQCATDMQEEIESSLEGNDLVYSATQGADCLSHLEEVACGEETEEDPCTNVYTQQD